MAYLQILNHRKLTVNLLQESLVGEVVPDPMEGEQTWPTEEELKAAKGERE